MTLFNYRPPASFTAVLIPARAEMPNSALPLNKLFASHSNSLQLRLAAPRSRVCPRPKTTLPCLTTCLRPSFFYPIT